MRPGVLVPVGMSSAHRTLPIHPQLTHSGDGCCQLPFPEAPFRKKVVLPGNVSPYPAELSSASNTLFLGPGSVL